MHPGVLCEALDEAPPLLVLAICGVSAKFVKAGRSAERGRIWVAEARDMIFRSLDHVSTLTITAIQFLVMHDMHEGDFTSAWNLVGEST